MRTILHCDMNNFYASVEALLNPALKNYPLAVAGNPVKRTGIILAKNYLAKVYKVKTGEAIWEAKQKCPSLICVAPHYDKYEEYSIKAHKIYEKYTDKIEPFGIDECWLDVTESLSYFKCTGVELAKKIQDDIFDTLGLTISVGVSFGKTLSKLGSDMKKPRGLVEINKENHMEVLKKLDISDMIMIGKATTKKLRSMNINTLYDLAHYNKDILEKVFGVMGKKIYEACLGINDDEIVAHEESDIKSIGNGATAVKDMKTLEEIKLMVNKLADMVSTRLRGHHYKAKTLHLTIKFADFTYLGAQKTFNNAFNDLENISKISLSIFKELTNNEFEPIRAIRICCSNLEAFDGTEQISMFYDNKHEKLGYALDAIREKYGKDKIFLINDYNEF